jgi:hypothetical protein
MFNSMTYLMFPSYKVSISSYGTSAEAAVFGQVTGRRGIEFYNTTIFWFCFPFGTLSPSYNSSFLAGSNYKKNIEISTVFEFQ